MRIARFIAALTAVVLVAAACGSDGDADPQPAPTTGDTLPTDDQGATMPAESGPAISVADLLASDGEGTFLVSGYVFVIDGDAVVLADAIAESFPPQPAGAQVALDIDLQSVELSAADGNSDLAPTMWTETPVEIVGVLMDGTLVGATAAAS